MTRTVVVFLASALTLSCRYRYERLSIEPDTTSDAAAPIIVVQRDSGSDPAPRIEAGASGQCDPGASPLTLDTDNDGQLDIFDTDDDNDGISDIDECFTQRIDLLVNGGFEEPFLGPNEPKISFRSSPDVPGWSTTASDDFIELWQTGYEGIDSAVGEQHVELNANEESGLYQDLATLPGTSVSWAFYHRGRDSVETIELRLGAPGSEQSVGQFSTGMEDWAISTGTYEIPAGQSTTRFMWVSVDPVGSRGNLLDEATMEPVCELDTDSDGCVDSKDPD